MKSWSTEQVHTFLKETNGESFVLLDVRTEEEYRNGHIPGAIHLDYYAPDFSIRLRELPHNKLIIVYCRTVNRSGHAQSLLMNNGHDKVIKMDGGMVHWYRNGYPVEN